MDNDTIFKSSASYTLIERAYHPTMEKTDEILRAIMFLFEKRFGFIPRDFTVVNDSTASPWTDRENRCIHISCVYVYWAQIAFQFSHELFHFIIPGEVCRSMRWFEEASAALASLYFLGELSSYWEDTDLLGKKSYAALLRAYRQADLSSVEVFDIHQLSNPSSPLTLAFLEENGEYDRPKNKYIASLMIPIFDLFPQTWKAFPVLCKVPDGLPLSESFQKWIELAPPDTHAGIDMIKQLFYCS